MASFIQLPTELKLQIGAYLDVPSLASIIKTSSENRKIFTELLYLLDATTTSSTGPRAMTWGAITGNLTILELALSAGGPENINSLSYTTPQVLSRLDKTKLAQFPQRFGTPLHYAVISNQLQSAKWLLAHGAVFSLRIGSQGLCKCQHTQRTRTVQDPWWFPAHLAMPQCYNRPEILQVITAHFQAELARSLDELPEEVGIWAAECQSLLNFLVDRFGQVDAEYLEESDYAGAINLLFAASRDKDGVTRAVAALEREKVLKGERANGEVELLAGGD
ncbi:hypothetical protein QBC43DRAFT_334508 [Cladorrhinum sp. PSN259]|nr:hypothetical protein QBC43DRAFT_334508 [Cladorrhinum sp. PSN259]